MRKIERARQTETGDQKETEVERKEDFILTDVVNGILEDILHGQTDKLERHFDLVLKAYPDAVSIAGARERVAGRSTYLEILKKIPLSVLSRLYLVGWLDEKNIENYQNIINKLVREINDRIQGVGGIRLAEEINVKEFLENLKKNE